MLKNIVHNFASFIKLCNLKLTINPGAVSISQTVRIEVLLKALFANCASIGRWN